MITPHRPTPRPSPNAPSPHRARSLVSACLALVLLAAACGSDSDGTASDPGVAGTDPVTSTTEPDDASSTTEEPDPTTSETTEEPSTTSTSDAEPGSTTMPGEPFDLFIEDGDVLAVMGVAHDDTLNIRELPGVGFPVVATADPLEDGLIATGNERLLTGSIWYEVSLDGVTGWANSSFLAYLGATDDATAEYLTGDGILGAETMLDLGLGVAEAYASDDPPSRIVMSVNPTVGDLGEVTYDVVGLGDDATAGFRLHVFATESESGEGFDLRTIERTTFCTRGLTGELCS